MPIAPLHNFSAPSKESVHLAILALAIEGHSRCVLLFVIYTHLPCVCSNSLIYCIYKYESQYTYKYKNRALQFVNAAPPYYSDPIMKTIVILTNKITSFEKFNAEYPGFGGNCPSILFTVVCTYIHILNLIY